MHGVSCSILAGDHEDLGGGGSRPHAIGAMNEGDVVCLRSRYVNVDLSSISPPKAHIDHVHTRSDIPSETPYRDPLDLS